MLSDWQVVSVKTYTCHFISLFYDFGVTMSYILVIYVKSHFKTISLSQESLNIENCYHPFTFYQAELYYR